MFKVNTKKILLKIPTVYDYQPTVSQEVRKQVIQYVLQRNPKLQIKGGNSLTNPYKIPYELVMAEGRESLEKYKKSVLWSPRFTPWHFKFAFFYPALFVGILMWYLTYVSIPKRIMYLRKHYGYICQDMVVQYQKNKKDKGWVDGWLDDEEDDVQVGDPLGFDFRSMSFKQVSDQVQFKQYTDFTLKDLQNFEQKSIYIDQSLEVNKNQTVQTEEKRLSKEMTNYKNKMQGRMEKIYHINQEKQNT